MKYCTTILHSFKLKKASLFLFLGGIFLEELVMKKCISYFFLTVLLAGSMQHPNLYAINDEKLQEGHGDNNVFVSELQPDLLIYNSAEKSPDKSEESEYEEELERIIQDAHRKKGTHRGNFFDKVKRAEKIVDSLIGNKDGKLTPEEVVDFLKKVAEGLKKVKTVVVGALAEKKESSEVPQKRGFSFPRPRIIKIPKVASIKFLKEKLGSKAKNLEEHLITLAKDLKSLEEKGIQEILDFIAEHRHIIRMIKALQKKLSSKSESSCKESFEVASLEKSLSIAIDRIELIEENFFVEVSECDVSEAEDEESFNEEAPLVRRQIFSNPTSFQREVSFDKESWVIGFMQEEANELFEQLVDLEEDDKDLTLHDVPGLFKKIKKEIKIINNLENKFKSLGKESSKSSRMTIATVLVGVGKLLFKVKKVIDSSKELGKNANQFKAQLDDEIKSLARFNDDLRGQKRVNLQAIGKGLEATLILIEKLGKAIDTVEKISNSEGDSSVKSYLKMINWEEVGLATKNAVEVVSYALIIGASLGAWSI